MGTLISLCLIGWGSGDADLITKSSIIKTQLKQIGKRGQEMRTSSPEGHLSDPPSVACGVN